MTDNRTTETATSRIIATLRERNVQFATYGNTDRVWWTTENGVTWYAQDRPNVNELFVKLEAVLTPEQAIAATLGTEINGETSDGYHTFNELYHHRAVLFSVIVRDNREHAWKARKHHDGTMYDGMFIVGIDTPDGQATYHYDLDPYWKMFDCEEREFAPEWDGHTPDDAIARIAKLGSRECSIEERNGDWYCTGCGEMVGTCDTASELYIDGNAIELWNHCPQCGKAVKR